MMKEAPNPNDEGTMELNRRGTNNTEHRSRNPRDLTADCADGADVFIFIRAICVIRGKRIFSRPADRSSAEILLPRLCAHRASAVCLAILFGCGLVVSSCGAPIDRAVASKLPVYELKIDAKDLGELQ